MLTAHPTESKRSTVIDQLAFYLPADGKTRKSDVDRE
ncbi:hypothetical protein [Rhodohalobacter sp.]